MEPVKVCIACLTTNSKLLSINTSMTKYMNVCSLLLMKDGIPPYICVNCNSLVNKFDNFKDRCLKVYGLLMEMIEDKKFNEKALKNVDRNIFGSHFVLAEKHNKTNYYDLELEYQENYFDNDFNDNDFLDNSDSDFEIKDDLGISNIKKNEIYLNDDFNMNENDIIKTEKDELDDIPLNQLKTTNKRVTRSRKSDLLNDNNDTVVATNDIDIDKVDNKNNKAKTKKKNETKRVKKEIKVKDKSRSKRSSELQVKMKQYFRIEVFTTLEEKLKSFEKRKSNNVYLKSPFKCDLCYRGFLNVDSYETHQYKHTDKCGMFSCPVCKFRSLTKLQMGHHLYVRHGRSFHCKLCEFESNDKYRATLHIKFHEGKTYQCTFCDKEFNHRINLSRHLRGRHPSSGGSAVCALCGFAFSGASGLSAHHTLVHAHQRTTLVDGPSCTSCDIKFLSQKALDTHLKVSPKHGNKVNLNKPNYHLLHRMLKDKVPKQKSERDRSTTKIVRKKGGIRSEKREKRLTMFDEPVPCEKCATPMHSATEYHYHFKTSHPNEKRTWYPSTTHTRLCEICGQMLRMNALKDHMVEHEEGVFFSCEVCHKKFSKKFNMKLHARAHLGERYPCAVCGKLFNHMGNRDRHLKYVHTEVKNSKCDFCTKSFKNEATKRLHINHVHLRKPYPKRNRNRERQIDTNKRRERETGDGGFRTDCDGLWE